jgi:hypothetical protein
MYININMVWLVRFSGNHSTNQFGFDRCLSNLLFVLCTNPESQWDGGRIQASLRIRIHYVLLLLMRVFKKHTNDADILRGGGMYLPYPASTWHLRLGTTRYPVLTVRCMVRTACMIHHRQNCSIPLLLLCRVSSILRATTFDWITLLLYCVTLVTAPEWLYQLVLVNRLWLKKMRFQFTIYLEMMRCIHLRPLGPDRNGLQIKGPY